MALVPLICGKCGGSLDFPNGLITKCGSCKTPYAWVADNGFGRKPVSYVPMPPQAGKMTVPLKIAIADAITKSTNYVVGDRAINLEYVREEDGGKFSYWLWIQDDEDPLMISLIKKENVDEESVTFWGRKQTVKFMKLVCRDTMKISIDSVSIDGQMVGNSVRVMVLNPKYEKQANEICQLIMDSFGVVPVCTLFRG